MSSPPLSSSSEPPVTLSSILTYVRNVARNEPQTAKSDVTERDALLGLRDSLFIGPKKAPNTSKKRKKLEEAAQTQMTQRPCSPTLFSGSLSNNSDGAAPASPPPYKRINISKDLEACLDTIISPLYDHPANIDDDTLIPAHRFTSLGHLLLPIRRPTIFEKWTLHEISVFESGISLHGKKFDIIKALLPNKTTQQVVEFYYIWKNTHRKDIWKKTFKQVDVV